MKAKPMFWEDGVMTPCEPKKATHVYLSFHNEDHMRLLPIQIKGTRAGTGNWTWNGDTEKPTIKPSISTNGTWPITDDEHKRIMSGEEFTPRPLKCHVWVGDGRVQHLRDCTCGLAGETHDLDEVDL